MDDCNIINGEVAGATSKVNSGSQTMPARIRRRRWVASHIAIAIQPVVYAVSRRELACRWIIIPRVIVIQPRSAIGPLPGITQAGWRGATAVADIAIRRVELGRGDGSAAVQRLGDRPLPVGGQVGEWSVGADTLGGGETGSAEVFGQRRAGPGAGNLL